MPPIFLAQRDAFAYQFAVSPGKWSQHNVSRLLRATGERPERVAEMRAILGDLGMGDARWPCTGGVWDHGQLWSRFSFPWIIVGHPYYIDADQRALLADLSRRFPGLRVGVDDRSSYYGFGTHHVRVELVERRRPWKSYPSTPATRDARRAARKAFAEVGLQTVGSPTL
jgi:hypothetical protein